jgi:hypothetical protein
MLKASRAIFDVVDEKIADHESTFDDANMRDWHYPVSSNVVSSNVVSSNVVSSKTLKRFFV